MWFYAQISGTPDSKRVRIDGLAPGTEWSTAKIKIAITLGLPDAKCRFIHKGKVLEDKLGTLYQCRVQNEDVLIVQILQELKPRENLSPSPEKYHAEAVPGPEEDEYGLLVAHFVCKVCQKHPRRAMCRECGCAQCGVKDDSAENVVCEECEHWYHWQCLDPPLDKLPDDDWYCPVCRNDTSEVIKPGETLTSKQQTKRGTGSKGSGFGNIGHPKQCTIVSKSHRGPIPGIEVGQSWKSRAYCGGDGVHRPPIAGIAGSALNGGAVSIVLSDGYPEDKDYGEKFTYTGSGGRDLKSGNGRTAMQSFDQQLTLSNLALAMTCDAKINVGGATAEDWKKSLAIRVVRGFGLRKWHPRYAPKAGYRYDGIYRIVSYAPGKGAFGHIVYRFEFRRDDTAPPPWTEEGKLRIQHLELEMVAPKIVDDKVLQTTKDLPPGGVTIDKGVNEPILDGRSRKGTHKRTFDAYTHGLTEDGSDVFCDAVSCGSDCKGKLVGASEDYPIVLTEVKHLVGDHTKPLGPPAKCSALDHFAKSKSMSVARFEPTKLQKTRHPPTKSPRFPQSTTLPATHLWNIPEELQMLIDRAIQTTPSHEALFEPLLAKAYRNLRSFITTVEQILECPICKEFVQMPVTSPCGHIACLRCINFSVDTFFGTKCSLCRASLLTIPQESSATENSPNHRQLWRKLVSVDRALVEVLRFCVPDYCKDMEAEEQKIRKRNW